MFFFSNFGNLKFRSYWSPKKMFDFFSLGSIMRILSRALLGTARQKRIITSILQGTSCTTCTRLQSHSRSNSDWSSKKIRKTYIDFFRDQHKHDYYPASSVVPPKGSGTFFTNAGMNQVSSCCLTLCQLHST